MIWCLYRQVLTKSCTSLIIIIIISLPPLHPMGNASSPWRGCAKNKGLPFPGSRRGGRWTFGLPSLSQREVIKCIKYICFPFSSCWVSQPKSHNRTMRFGKFLPPTSAPLPTSSAAKSAKWDCAAVPR